MVGFPMLSGFISKLLFATSALQSPHKMLPTVIALAISTILNAVYFLRLVITLYSIPETSRGQAASPGKSNWKLQLSVVCFILLNLTLGLYSQPIVEWIGSGLAMFD